MKIWLVRHAESQANAGMTTSDPALIELTERGREQAFQVSQEIEDAPSKIIVSSFIRTKQTAQPTINKFDSVPVEVWDVHEFTYLSPDRCQNTTVQDRKGSVQEYWSRCDPDYLDGSGAESFQDLLGRVKAFYEKLIKLDGEFFVIFSHMQFISAFRWFLLNKMDQSLLRDMKFFYKYLEKNKPGNGEIVKIDDMVLR